MCISNRNKNKRNKRKIELSKKILDIQKWKKTQNIESESIRNIKMNR